MDASALFRRFDSPRFLFRLWGLLALVLVAFTFLAARSAYRVETLDPATVAVEDPASFRVDIVDLEYGKRRVYVTLQAYDENHEDVIGVYNRRLVLRDTHTGNFLLMPSEMVMYSQERERFEPIPLLPHNFSRLNNKDVAIRGVVPLKSLPEPHERFEIGVLTDKLSGTFHVLATGVPLLRGERP